MVLWESFVPSYRKSTQVFALCTELILANLLAAKRVLVSRLIAFEESADQAGTRSMAFRARASTDSRSPRRPRWGTLKFNGNSMAHTGDPNPPRWSAEESFLELLTDTLDAMDRPSRGPFLQRFFRSIAQIDLTETQSLDFWDQALARKRELSESIGKRVALQAALVDVLASTGQLRLPIYFS
jgi:hypothetical protein